MVVLVVSIHVDVAAQGLLWSRVFRVEIVRLRSTKTPGNSCCCGEGNHVKLSVQDLNRQTSLAQTPGNSLLL